MGSTPTKPGYRVLSVSPGSPADKAGLVPFLDFIVEMNGTPLAQSEMPFQELIMINKECKMKLGVYSLLTGTIREISVEAKEDWGGQGLLGLVLRFEDALAAAEKLFHVTQVLVDSPAYNAGLRPGDFILGSMEYNLPSPDEIAALAESKGSAKLMVFKQASKTVEEVVINGAPLGCELAQGVLHSLA